MNPEGWIGLLIIGAIGIGALIYDAVRENKRFNREGRSTFGESNASVKTNEPNRSAPNYPRRRQGAILALLLMASAAWWFWPRVEFTDAAISTTKTSIRDHYQKDNVFEVLDVVLIRDTPRHLMGFVKARNKLTKAETSIACSATMGDKGDSYWQCK